MEMRIIDRSRHEALWPAEQAAAMEAMIVGCGAIGSWTALCLAKMGVRRMTLIDFDKVGPENVSIQAFGVLDIGANKAQALKDTLVRDCEITPAEIAVVEEAFVKDMAREVDVCVASMDNLPGRQAVWAAMKEKAKLFVDPRMGGQWLEVYAIERGDEVGRKEYEPIINPAKEDMKFSEEPCSARAVAYTALTAGAQISNIIRQWAMKEKGRIKTQLFDIAAGRAWTIDPEAAAKGRAERMKS